MSSPLMLRTKFPRQRTDEERKGLSGAEYVSFLSRVPEEFREEVRRRTAMDRFSISVVRTRLPEIYASWEHGHKIKTPEYNRLIGSLDKRVAPFVDNWFRRLAALSNYIDLRIELNIPKSEVGYD